MPDTNRAKVIQGMDLIDSMTDEELNSLVDYIRTTYKARKSQKNAKARATLKAGDRVRIVGPTKPQYLAGQTGTVETFGNTRITIRLDGGPVGKFRTGNVITPPSMLEKI